mmetsp:Transcript_30029/g.70339  ORF Transcript_30029/g.70339 Transcript_30029/m.70339 type:complete len:301 (+) Transcript_30029:92-994(+)
MAFIKGIPFHQFSLPSRPAHGKGSRQQIFRLLPPYVQIGKVLNQIGKLEEEVEKHLVGPPFAVFFKLGDSFRCVRFLVLEIRVIAHPIGFFDSSFDELGAVGYIRSDHISNCSAGEEHEHGSNGRCGVDGFVFIFLVAPLGRVCRGRRKGRDTLGLHFRFHLGSKNRRRSFGVIAIISTDRRGKHRHHLVIHILGAGTDVILSIFTTADGDLIFLAIVTADAWAISLAVSFLFRRCYYFLVVASLSTGRGRRSESAAGPIEMILIGTAILPENAIFPRRWQVKALSVPVLLIVVGVGRFR